MFGSIAAEGKASVVGSIHPSAEGATGSELRVGAAAGRSTLTLTPTLTPSGSEAQELIVVRVGISTAVGVVRQHEQRTVGRFDRIAQPPMLAGPQLR